MQIDPSSATHRAHENKIDLSNYAMLMKYESRFCCSIARFTVLRHTFKCTVAVSCSMRVLKIDQPKPGIAHTHQYMTHGRIRVSIRVISFLMPRARGLFILLACGIKREC